MVNLRGCASSTVFIPFLIARIKINVNVFLTNVQKNRAV
jgi:hypothetical protein